MRPKARTAQLYFSPGGNTIDDQPKIFFVTRSGAHEQQPRVVRDSEAIRRYRKTGGVTNYLFVCHLERTRTMHSLIYETFYGERDQVMLDFKNGKIDVLVATDVVSRGIDVTDIPLVINYDVPHAPEDYVHRIGRTARAENSGEAMTLVSPDDVRYWKRIEKFLTNGESATRSGKGYSGGSRHSSRNRAGHPHKSKGQARGGHRKGSKPQS